MACSSAFLFLSLLATLSVGVTAQAGAGTQDPKAQAPKAQAPKTQAPKPARPADEKALFAAFAQIRGLACSYTEKKHLSLLAVPLRSRGKLYFLRPGYLSRIVEAPEKSQLTITATELRMADKNGTEVIDLRQSDRVRLFVTSLVRVFQGDREGLAKHYRLAYLADAKDPAGWRLELTPQHKELQEILKQLVLFGSGETVTRIELHEPNGDRTVTTIVKVDAKRTFTTAERAEIFGIEPKPGSGKPGKLK